MTRSVRSAAPLVFALGVLPIDVASAADASPDAPPAADTTSDVRLAPAVLWLAGQFVPSPEGLVGDQGARFGLRWQVTPLLYSWGIQRGLSPWRSFVVTPNLRTSGSVEFYVSPEVLFLNRTELHLRPGLRAYFPLLAKGEYLSASVGVSYQSVGGVESASYELGAYVLYGVFGVQIAASPSPSQPAQGIATFSVRYF